MRTLLCFLLIPLSAACKVERLEPGAALPPLATSGVVALLAPDDSEMPAGPEAASIRRGRALLRFTPDSLPGYVGNALSCTNCHLDDGTRPFAAPWVGVYGRFPQYRSRNAKVNVIGDRINDCMERSLNGRPLPADGPDMRDMVAYMAFLSRRIPNGATMLGQGFATLPALTPDPSRGRQVFNSKCVKCHAKDGLGTEDGPPLWGPRSYTIAAGMARVRTAAAFIHRNMPDDKPRTLTAQQAFDVAAYMNSHPRPDFVDKENDWPDGDHPPDVPYMTRSARAKADSTRRGK